MNVEETPIRILCVEDHPIFRDGLAAIIASQADLSLIAQVDSAPEAMLAYRHHQPDVTLLDLRLSNGNGIQVLKLIRKEVPKARVIMLTSSENEDEIREALESGAAGYLLKNTPRSELLAGIRAVHAGRRLVTTAIASRLVEHLGEERLTERELQILKLIQHGLRNKPIADHLGIAETTVNFHIKNIVNKLHANDRTHAVVIALRRGWLTL